MARNAEAKVGTCPTCGNSIPPGRYNNLRPQYCDSVCRNAWHRGVRLEPWADDLLADAITDDEDQHLALALARDVHRELALLDYAHRRVIEMRMDELPYVEIGRRLGMSPERAKQLESQAHKALAMSRGLYAWTEYAALHDPVAA